MDPKTAVEASLHNPLDAIQILGGLEMVPMGCQEWHCSVPLRTGPHPFMFSSEGPSN